MSPQIEPYVGQVPGWPVDGRHILAQYNEQSVVVYQAYCQPTGRYAAEHGHFGSGFSFSRMSWIKPNFLWMMYRSGWGQKEGQETVLAIRLQRSAFDTILAQSVPSMYDPSHYSDPETWQKAVRQSNVRLQWDPDRHPSGAPLVRRAIQLGLRGDVLARYAGEWIVEIEDISSFVQEQRRRVVAHDYSELMVPSERVYPVEDEALRQRLGLSTPRSS